MIDIYYILGSERYETAQEKLEPILKRREFETYLKFYKE